jgi:hypothetical protein
VGTATRVNESDTKQDDIERGWPGVHTLVPRLFRLVIILWL